jgi:hypothetical protein
MNTAKEIERAQRQFLKRSRKYELCEVVSRHLFGSEYYSDGKRFLPMRTMYKRLADAGYEWNGTIWVFVGVKETTL